MFFNKFRGNGGVKWLVVFLGNPGAKYAYTRHNAGWMAAEAFEKKHGTSIDKMKFKSVTAVCEIGGEKVMLMKPMTYMNLSGEAVIQAVNFYKIQPENVVVVSDEISLPIGKMRIRKSGSAGGHNGLKNIIKELGTDAFPRIRIGVGAPPHKDYDMADWVLAAFQGQDLVDMTESTAKAADAVECLISEGPDKAMNKYN